MVGALLGNPGRPATGSRPRPALAVFIDDERGWNVEPSPRFFQNMIAKLLDPLSTLQNAAMRWMNQNIATDPIA